MNIEQIYKEQYEPLRVASIRLGLSPDQFEDAFQEAILKVWTNLDNFDSEKSRLNTWMNSIFQNQCFDMFFRKSIKAGGDVKVVDFDLDNPEILSLESDIAPPEPQSKWVNELMDSLPTKHRSVIHGIFFQGMSHGDAAAYFDLPLGTIKGCCRMTYGKAQYMLEKRGY